MRTQIWLLTEKLIVSSLLILSWINPVLAEPDQSLTRAEVYKLLNQVQLLLKDKPPRPAKKADVLVPLDALQTKSQSRAELLFNEGPLARIDSSAIFLFKPGLRRYEINEISKRIYKAETIFELKNGTALIITPPGSVGSEVETPEGQISIFAVRPVTAQNHNNELIANAKSSKLSQNSSDAVKPQSTTPNLFLPAQKGSAVMVVHDMASNTTQVFALTDGDIKISDKQGKKTVALQGGQIVAVKNGVVGTVQEFDLQGFYKLITLAAGLGPGQENLVAQESPPVQETLKAVRIETLAALKNQTKRFEGFTKTFLDDALNGRAGNLNSRSRTSVRISNQQQVTGTFIKQQGNTAVFIPDNNPNSPTGISVDFDKQTVTIDGKTGVVNKAGLSGNNASGSVIEANGQITQIEVFGVNGKQPDDNVPYRGTLSTGIARDR